jgi:hypothetical protein
MHRLQRRDHYGRGATASSVCTVFCKAASLSSVGMQGMGAPEVPRLQHA